MSTDWNYMEKKRLFQEAKESKLFKIQEPEVLDAYSVIRRNERITSDTIMFMDIVSETANRSSVVINHHEPPFIVHASTQELIGQLDQHRMQSFDVMKIAYQTILNSPKHNLPYICECGIFVPIINADNRMTWYNLMYVDRFEKFRVPTYSGYEVILHFKDQLMFNIPTNFYAIEKKTDLHLYLAKLWHFSHSNFGLTGQWEDSVVIVKMEGMANKLLRRPTNYTVPYSLRQLNDIYFQSEFILRLRRGNKGADEINEIFDICGFAPP